MKGECEIILCFWDGMKRVGRGRLVICFCYPHILVSSNRIYSTHCFTGLLAYITMGKKAWAVNGIELIKQALLCGKYLGTILKTTSTPL